MSEIFISYARSTEAQARQIAEALRALGYGVWRDDELPAHRSYAEVIEERLKAAKAVVVIWSAEAVKSEWVQSEADRARAQRKLVQLSLDETSLPMPFDRIQCADMKGWAGEDHAPGWKKVVSSIAELVGPAAPAGTEARPVAEPPALALPSKPSIAVLPFANLSNDPEQDYFCDGMVVEITNALSRFKSIFVIASGSSLSFKGKGVSPVEMAKRLGVRFVLEGSVRKAGNRIRIAVELIDAAGGAQIWTRRFEDTLDDLFTLQDEVSVSVAAVIEPAVQQAEVRRVAKRPTEDMGCYDLYLRALPLFREVTRAGLLQALNLTNQAIAIDPDYGAALAHGARCRYLIDLYGWSSDTEANRQEGIELARRALKAAGDDADTVAIVAGSLASLQQDFPPAAVALADRAVTLNPGSAYASWVCGAVRLMGGHAGHGIEQFETALRLDPIGPDRPRLLSFFAMARFLEGRYEDAVSLCGDCLQQAEIPMAYACMASSHGHLGQQGAASEALRRFRELSPQPIDVFAQRFFHDPTQLNSFLQGIARAEGKTPAAN